MSMRRLQKNNFFNLDLIYQIQVLPSALIRLELVNYFCKDIFI